MRKWISQRNLALLALAGAVSATVAGFFGAVWPPLDILSHMRTHFAGAALVAIAAIIWSRYAIAVLGAGAVSVLMAHAAFAWMQQDGHSLAGILPINPAAAAASAQASPPRMLKVLSYNTWHSNRQLGVLERNIANSDADIVMLYEFGPNKRPMLDKWRSRFPHQADCSAIWYCSVAILSRHPITSKRVMRRTADRAPTIVAELDVQGRKLTVVGTHLFRPIDGPRRQMREIRSLSRVLHGIEGDVLVGGDFNATRWSAALQTLVRTASLNRGNGFLPSWPRILPQLAIDHVFTRGRAHITKLNLAANGGADHLAIVGRIQLR